ncbi:MAG: T9SS type A sorting domain-containing protein [Bacteroidetes bacterium]|nr:T9SS type A sorting domain-containing protein [Bacteroidota bacterium]
MQPFFLILLFVLLSTISNSQQTASSICTPSTTAYCCGFGIINVSFNTINNTTAGGSDGYKDYSSTITTSVYAGATYSISVNVSGGNPGKQNVRAWIDYNNNNLLDSINELVFSANSVLTATGAITIPASAIKNIPLRLRISADYDFASPPTPCKNITYGQAEDYGIIILNNPLPPNTAFVANDTLTCSGVVSFTDISSNVPTTWLWNFGDGGTSSQQNPIHTYTTSGNYTVKLTTTNGNGSDKDSILNYIQVTLGNGPIAASCSPSTLGYCCQYGITKFKLNTINYTSLDATEGYKDNSCDLQTTLQKNTTYTVQVSTGTLNPHDVKIYIDYNNDGLFTGTNELVFSALNQNSPSGNILISSSAAILNTPLRLRAMADYAGSGYTSCTNLTYGQAEDYTVIITSANSMTENEQEDQLQVFPNPATDMLTILVPNGIEITNLELVDLFGNELINIKTLETPVRINTSAIANGYYFLRAQTATNSITKKIVIAK